jgi:hypothetical protein
MGDGPDWRQVDRARLIAVRLEERNKVLLEWTEWLEGRVAYVEDDGDLPLSELRAKAKELRARLPESKSTAMPETLPTPLAETKTTE